MYKEFVKTNIERMYKGPVSRWLMFLLGVLFFLPAAILYLMGRREDDYRRLSEEIQQNLVRAGEWNRLEEEVALQLQAKQAFFGTKESAAKMEQEKKRIAGERLAEQVRNSMRADYPECREKSFLGAVKENLDRSAWLALFTVAGFPALLYLLLMSNAYVKYISERLVMTLFVVIGVAFLVFTVLYMSPMDPAVNVLGELATEEQIVQFNQAYGLDQPYPVQLFHSLKGLLTLDMGNSYLGNEDVVTSIMNKFPVTLQLTFASMILSVAIAIPSGIISALKPYSAIDYIVMLLALIGLSIPGFWLGLILILNLSINLGWLPATFVVGTWKAFVMPGIVLGTGLAASVARMTRSSLLEVIKQDYIVTAKAKGLSQRQVVMRHALGNAMIPIVTVIGIQFGMMLGGAAVTEKVFNVNGIGSFIVDKQFIPDMPVVLAGVVYIAIVVSLTNLFVDILYAFLDPRIKAKLKSY